MKVCNQIVDLVVSQLLSESWHALTAVVYLRVNLPRLALCLAKIPSGHKMSLIRELVSRFETSYRPEWSRSVPKDLNENRTKHRMRGW